MNPLERMVSLVAPHVCVGCGTEGSLLCSGCAESRLTPLPSRCYSCHMATVQNRSCQNCRRRSGIAHVWVAVEYQEEAKQLIHKFKFERAQAAAKVIAELMDRKLPMLPKGVVVTYVPTAHGRVRVRGYDQARLLAKALARRRGWQYQALLSRTGSGRQVGSTRQQRFTQLETAFKLDSSRKAIEGHILLVDDVLTTGASVEAASSVLKSAGAKTIDVAVFAQP